MWSSPVCMRGRDTRLRSVMPLDSDKPSLLSTLVDHYEELLIHVRRRFGYRNLAR